MVLGGRGGVGGWLGQGVKAGVEGDEPDGCCGCVLEWLQEGRGEISCTVQRDWGLG